jgi:HK97 family phage prohead protease
MKRRNIFGIRRSIVVDGQERTAFVASTDASDRLEDIVDQASWKLDNYRRNPVVLTDHDYSAAAVVGRGAVSVVEGVGLVLDVEKWSGKQTAEDVRADVEAGVINAVSVGFCPGRSVPRKALDPAHPYFKPDGCGYVFYDCELLEVSIVAVPANPEAVAVRANSAAEQTNALIDTLIKATAAYGARERIMLDTSTKERETLAGGAAALSDLFAPVKPAALSDLFFPKD